MRRQVVDLPSSLFSEASAARLLLGAPPGAGGGPNPDPGLERLAAAKPVASPLLLPAGAEVGSGLVAEALGLLAGGWADIRVQVSPFEPCPSSDLLGIGALPYCYLCHFA